MDAKLRYKAKKIKIVFLILMIHSEIPRPVLLASIPNCFKQLREKEFLTGIASGRGFWCCAKFVTSSLIFVTLNGIPSKIKKVRSFINIRLRSQVLSISLGPSKKNWIWLGWESWCQVVDSHRYDWWAVVNLPRFGCGSCSMRKKTSQIWTFER